jgi:general secretion pathway protein E
MDIGVPPYLIKATVIGVVAQRLVRTLCPHCKQQDDVEESAWQALTHPWRLPLPQKAQHSVGCEKCRHTGYLGRLGIYEMLRINHKVKELIRPDGGIEAIRKVCLKQGMEPLRISGARKVISGLTTVEEVLRVVPSMGDI